MFLIEVDEWLVAIGEQKAVGLELYNKNGMFILILNWFLVLWELSCVFRSAFATTASVTIVISGIGTASAAHAAADVFAQTARMHPPFQMT